MLSKITPLLKSQVIQKYLHAFSMNEIVREIPLSKGTVHGIIQDWRSNVGGTNTEEIRAFTSEVRKSGITIEECAQGYRIIQLFKKFDINDEFDVGVYEEYEHEDLELDVDKSNFPTTHDPSTQHTNEITNPNENGNKKSTKIENNKIIYFLDHIYKNCKNLGITPNIMTEWIEDLLLSFYDFATEIDKDNDYNDMTSSGINNAAEKKENDLNRRKEIPFVSSVTFYIKQKEERIRHLKKIKISVSKEIDVLTKQRQDITSRLNKTIEAESKVFSYFKWYENLKKELFYEHTLQIELEFGAFANAINDFNQYSFDVTKILVEYRHIDSLRNELVLVQDQVNNSKVTRDQLNEEISSLEERGNYYRQTIHTFKELQNNGFGLKELKHLNNTLMESALANDLSVKDSGKKFLIDLDNQYDNKLGFEKKVQELKNQMKDLENQIPGYKQYLELQIGAVSSLSHLYANGVTNTDIINMNQLVLIFRNSDFLSDPLDQNPEKGSKNQSNNAKTNETMYWQQFIAKLQSLKNINQKINKQVSNLNVLKKQIDILTTNKQQLEKGYTDVVSNLENILLIIHQSLDAARQFNEDIDKKKVMPIPIVFPVLVNFDSSSNNKLDEKREKNKTDK
jgi:hypothetical protein